jgi:hypothetical protein
MKELAQLLNEMRAVGVIANYALFGAMAQMRYTEAVATLDADVLVAVASPERIDVLAGIYGFFVSDAAFPPKAMPSASAPGRCSSCRRSARLPRKLWNTRTPRSSMAFPCASCGRTTSLRSR